MQNRECETKRVGEKRQNQEQETKRVGEKGQNQQHKTKHVGEKTQNQEHETKRERERRGGIPASKRRTEEELRRSRSMLKKQGISHDVSRYGNSVLRLLQFNLFLNSRFKFAPASRSPKLIASLLVSEICMTLPFLILLPSLAAYASSGTVPERTLA